MIFFVFALAACASGEPQGNEFNEEQNIREGDVDNDGEPGDNDGDGEPGDNDGDGEPGDNDGDGEPGDNDGEPGDNDGDRDVEPETCYSNDDCESGEICIRSAPGAQGVCGDPAENRGDGASCSSSNQCQSGLCYNQTCTRECDDASDCAEGWLCREQGGVGVCEAASGCSATRDCDVTGDVCVVERNGETRVICHPPVGPGDLGDSCSSDADCEAGLCLDSMCSQPCEGPSDCDDSGDYICSLENVGGLNLNVCKERPLESCLSDNDCSGGERCVATVNADDELLFACGTPNAGGNEGGGSCANDAGCAQNLCIDGACAAPCHNDSICTGIPASTCTSKTVTRGNASGSVSTCTVPQVCESISECSGSETCYILYGTNSLDTICRAPNTTNRGDGEACSSNSQCASNYCRAGRFGNYCSSPCASSNDCPAEVEGYSMECGPSEIAYANGTELVNTCVRSEPPACTSDAQCGAGKACAFVTTASGSGLETVCLPDNGGASVGASCTAHSDCRSQYCLEEGYCSGACTDRDQCHAAQLCEQSTASKDGQSGSFQMCIEVPIQACNSSLDCSPGDLLTCNYIYQDAADNYGALCWFKTAGGSPLGASCTADTACESSMCWGSDDGTTGECTVVCESGSRDCGAGQVCSGLVDDVRICRGSCARDADCDGGNVCRLGIDETGLAVHSYCAATIGDKPTGEECDESIECVTGLCLTITTYQPYSDEAYCGLTTDPAYGGNCDVHYPGFPTCACPMDDPDCDPIHMVCSAISEESVCSELCDPANGDADCAGTHDLNSCSTSVTVTWGSNSQDVAACSYGIEEG